MRHHDFSDFMLAKRIKALAKMRAKIGLVRVNGADMKKS